MVKLFFTLLSKQLRFQKVFEYFGWQAFIVLDVLMTAAAWLWIGHQLAIRQIDPRSAVAVHVLILMVQGALLSFQKQQRYVYAVILFIAAQLLLPLLMALMTADWNLLRTYMLAVVIAAALLGPFGSYLTCAASIVIVLGLANHSASIDVPGIVGQLFLTGIITGRSALSLYEALISAENEGFRSRQYAEDARMHRAELVQANKSLDITQQQLLRANMEMFYARQSADSALRFKREFAAQISHELRTSLNLILGFSETMMFSQHIYQAKLPQPYLRDVTEIHRSSKHILGLIDDILDLSKLEAGRMGIVRKDQALDGLVRDAVEMIQPLIALKGLNLRLDLPDPVPIVSVDETRVRQVLLNLLNNAVRVSTKGDLIVRVLTTGNSVTIQVQDTGPGIPREQLSRVFEQYFQVESTAGNTGLGLTVSKQLIELHGGHIWAESEPGQGCTFSFTLPALQLPLITAVPGQARLESPSTLPALIVIGEQESDYVRLLTRLLDAFTITAAQTLEQVISAARRTSARAVITSAPLAEIPETLIVPVITCPLVSTHDIAARLGIRALIQKPLTLHGLHQVIDLHVLGAERFLVVDNEPGAVRLIERMLKARNKRTQVFSAYGAREALERAQIQAPDAILLDLAMPEESGFWLVQALQSKAELSTIPIIAVSGQSFDDEQTQQAVTIARCDGFSADEVLRYLQALLSALPPAPVDRHTRVQPLKAADLR